MVPPTSVSVTPTAPGSRASLAELAAWSRAQGCRSLASFESYLRGWFQEGGELGEFKRLLRGGAVRLAWEGA